MDPTRRLPDPRDARVLGVVFLLSVGIRVWILEGRWINPDEGSHLMDAVLALGGGVPQVDFASRQPFYVVFLAAALKLLGTSYTAGRLALCACSVLTGGALYGLGRLLFGPAVGLLAASLFWMLPLEILASTNVKTEPLAMLLATTSLLFAAAAWRTARPGWMVAAGVLAALGFEVRESTLVVPVVIFCFVAIRQGWRPGPSLRHFVPFLAGYVGTFLLVLAFYARYLSPGELLTSSLWPIGFAANLLASSAPGSSGTGAAFSQGYGESPALHLSYVADALAMHLFLALGFALALFRWPGGAAGKSDPQGRREGLACHAVPLLWAGLLAVAYTLQFSKRGFFIDYFRELLPPLALGVAAWGVSTFPALARGENARRVVLFGVMVGAAWLALQRLFPDTYGVGHHASLAVIGTAFVFFRTRLPSGRRRRSFAAACWVLTLATIASRKLPGFDSLSGPLFSAANLGLALALPFLFLGPSRLPGVATTLRFLALGGLVATTALSLSQSAFRLSLHYETVWSPESVETVASYLREHTTPGAEVMSGAVIWEFAADRRPFASISHPLVYKREVSEEWKQHILAVALRQPPEAVVLDGYTELIYLRNVPALKDLLERDYQLVLEAGPAHSPLQVLARRDRTASRAPLP